MSDSLSVSLKSINEHMPKERHSCLKDISYLCNITNVSNLKSATIISTTHCLSDNANQANIGDILVLGVVCMNELAFLRTQGVKRLREQWAVVRFAY